jgi:vacuolar-type H+-ATPase subunit H
MPRQFTYLNALASEIDKLEFETEAQAKDIIEKDLSETRKKRDQVMDIAKNRISDHAKAVTDLNENLDKVITQLSNSGDQKNPT